jgi:hypothetical protein
MAQVTSTSDLDAPPEVSDQDDWSCCCFLTQPGFTWVEAQNHGQNHLVDGGFNIPMKHIRLRGRDPSF